MYWDKLLSFHRIAKLKNITKAAQSLNICQSAVSRQLLLIEKQLDTKLVIRKHNGIQLTPQGEVLFQAVENMFAEVKQAEALIQEVRNDPQGEIRILSTYGIANYWLVDPLIQFKKKYPKINLVILGVDSQFDVQLNEYDVMVRPYINGRKDLKQTYLTTFRFGLFASKEYLDQHGTPQHINELKQHQHIALGNFKYHPWTNVDWHLSLGLKGGKTHPAHVQANSVNTQIKFAEAGLGIVSLPLFHPFLRQSSLVRILKDIEPPTIDTYFTYSINLENVSRINLLQTELVDHFKAFQETK